MKRHFIYVIGREEGPVKVGITSSPADRLRTLQTGCPFKLTLFQKWECADRSDAIEHEDIFGGVCADSRIIGEWFDMTAEHAVRVVNAPFAYDGGAK
jgi:hypothetical protein